jgi:hypothetical protein
VQQPHRTPQIVGVALLLRGDDRRAGALLFRGVLGRSSFAVTTGVLGRRRPECWGGDDRSAGIEEGAAAATSEKDLGFRNETRRERERPGRTGIRPTLTCGTH